MERERGGEREREGEREGARERWSERGGERGNMLKRHAPVTGLLSAARSNGGNTTAGSLIGPCCRNRALSNQH